MLHVFRKPAYIHIMNKASFKGSFTQQDALPPEALANAMAVLQSGRLHRYNTAPGEVSETALLEAEYRDWQGAPYCLAVASGGQAIQLALRAAGVLPRDVVLTNAFTLAPVPGAITAVGGKTVLVDVTENLVIDLDDLATKAKQSGARFLLLSLMRGHMPDMDALTALCAALGLSLIEDCAHTMGASWNGTKSGNFGVAGCFSTQTYKHMNSGEGGFLTSSDPGIIARATVMSGSYMHFDKHGAGPVPAHFTDPRLDMPNMSARMDNLRAAILRPQLRQLENKIKEWNRRYSTVENIIGQSPHATMIARQGQFVGSSIQFRVINANPDWAEAFLARLAARGVVVSWFGVEEPQGFTSSERHWRYLDRQTAPQAAHILSTLFDMRLPLSFSVADCILIAEIIVDELSATSKND